VMQQLAVRELARENTKELIVSFAVPGHLNEAGNPIAPDQCYDIVWDAANLDKRMYLYGVNYKLSDDGGQTTMLEFCNLDTIVGGGKLFE